MDPPYSRTLLNRLNAVKKSGRLGDGSKIIFYNRHEYESSDSENGFNSDSSDSESKPHVRSNHKSSKDCSKSGIKDDQGEGASTSKLSTNIAQRPTMALDMLRDNSEISRMMMTKIDDLTSMVHNLTSKVEGLETRLADSRLEKSISLVTPEPRRQNTIYRPLITQSSSRSSTIHPSPQNASFAEVTPINAHMSRIRPAIANPSPQGDIVPYDRNGQIFSVLILSIVRDIMRKIELERHVSFVLDLKSMITKMTTIIETLSRESRPHISLNDVLKNKEFLETIPRRKKNELLNVSAVSINGLRVSNDRSTIFATLTLLFKELKKVTLILPAPLSDIIEGLGDMIVEGNNFIINTSDIKPRERTADEIFIQELKSNVKTDFLKAVIGGVTQSEVCRQLRAEHENQLNRNINTNQRQPPVFDLEYF
ncbi:hypothetical protein DFH28DRAFT_1015850 [Melampsora americana]|nr:hypothetical protein DFH28DRAFT_1015850 [Melampsora americana]